MEAEWKSGFFHFHFGHIFLNIYPECVLRPMFYSIVPAWWGEVKTGLALPKTRNFENRVCRIPCTQCRVFETPCGDPEEWEVWGSNVCPWQRSVLHPSVAHQERPHQESPQTLTGQVLRSSRTLIRAKGEIGYKVVP